ncbi:hypothetical protein N656DRAFT_795261 [Canariomyces notabilis]|uniref:Heterokaryon incompatibility domain-containing protein n=1 Tax=Canariomyces notabilis TaxID=2074819 RepID=A0AAN6TJA0_9PEZI|nr:hypothetical protein N656DRAFT_795261 [Canariomyces arenarius]
MGFLSMVDRIYTLPSAVSLGLYLGAQGLFVWSQPNIRAALLAICTAAVRDGPTLRRDFGLFSPGKGISTVAAYLVPAALGMLLNPTYSHYVYKPAVLAFKWAWAETIPLVLSGLWRRDLTSWVMAAAAVYFRYDWRLVALVAVRRMYPIWIKSTALRRRLEPNAPLYRYQKITSPRTIRLLKIQPRLFGLSFSLVNYQLDTDNPASYEAVSYRWGSGERTRIVEIDGKVLPIPASAYDILWGRASVWRTRLMWIDAICINQDDKDDKNQQAGLMRDIYDRVTRTFIWLDKATDAWAAACFAYIFLMDMMAENGNGRSDLDVTVAQFGLKRIRDGNPKWAALKRMLENPYWSRVWIVQEIVVSHQVDIFYGGRWFDWGLFAPIVSSLKDESASGLLQKLDQSEGMATPPFRAIHQIQSIERLRADYQAGIKWPLDQILINFSISQATLGLDHVFAFHGISTAVKDHALVPDYKRPTLDVFKETTLHSMAQPTSLMILSMAGIARARESPDWPSWIPDFQLISQLDPPMPRSLYSYAPYVAGGGLRPSFSDIQTSNEVAIRGILIDEISAITELRPGDISQFRGLGEIGSREEKKAAELMLHDVARLREAQSLIESRCAQTYFNGQSRWEAFWRTCLGNKSLASYPADPAHGNYLKAFMDSNERHWKAILEGPGAASNPELLAALQIPAMQSAKNPGVSAEDTINTLEKLLQIPEEVGTIRDYVTPELLNDREKLFCELAAVTNLPYWARNELHNALFRSGGGGTGSSTQALELTKAMEELYVRAFDFRNIEDSTLKRVVLMYAFMLDGFLEGGEHIAMSDDQVQAFHKALEGDKSALVAINEKRIGLLLGSTVLRRQFAVTRRGFMTLVPPDSAAGDLVCIFQGAKVPHVLRKAANGKYWLVGEGYLHGFMDGEAFWDGRWRAEQITLV